LAESNEERESGRGRAYGGSVMAERRERESREAVEERERKREKRIRWAQQR
jgi:hypothetical protein